MSSFHSLSAVSYWTLYNTIKCKMERRLNTDQQSTHCLIQHEQQSFEHILYGCWHSFPTSCQVVQASEKQTQILPNPVTLHTNTHKVIYSIHIQSPSSLQFVFHLMSLPHYSSMLFSLDIIFCFPAGKCSMQTSQFQGHLSSIFISPLLEWQFIWTRWQHVWKKKGSNC